MHKPINVKSPNNMSKWQMGFNSAFKGLRTKSLECSCSSLLGYVGLPVSVCKFQGLKWTVHGRLQAAGHGHSTLNETTSIIHERVRENMRKCMNRFCLLAWKYYESHTFKNAITVALKTTVEKQQQFCLVDNCILCQSVPLTM
jgi:hypothetical protein